MPIVRDLVDLVLAHPDILLAIVIARIAAWVVTSGAKAGSRPQASSSRPP